MAEGAASWEALDKELSSMVDLFSTLIKASRIPDDESDQLSMREGRKDRAPGDLLEVWAEKLVQAAHSALRHVGALKAAAAFSDFEVLMSRVRSTRFAMSTEEQMVASALTEIRSDAGALLASLEDSYYSTPHRGRPVSGDVTAEIKELAAVTLELAERQDTLRGPGGGSGGGGKP